jgi:hypothetical protein
MASPLPKLLGCIFLGNGGVMGAAFALVLTFDAGEEAGVWNL